jgi:hypothetical protein
VRTEYPEELVLRDRASHISSGWAQVTSNDFDFQFLELHVDFDYEHDSDAISLLC